LRRQSRRSDAVELRGEAPFERSWGLRCAAGDWNRACRIGLARCAGTGPGRRMVRAVSVCQRWPCTVSGCL